MAINNVTLTGNLTRDPELRYTTSGKPVCNFGLAVNGRGGTNEVSFLDISCWEATAEAVGKHLKVGAQVGVIGRIKMDTWEVEGVKKSRLVIIANQVEFLDRKPQEPQEPQEPPEPQEQL